MLPASFTTTGLQSASWYTTHDVFEIGFGGGNQTLGLQVMSLTSYHCSTPELKVLFTQEQEDSARTVASCQE